MYEDFIPKSLGFAIRFSPLRYLRMEDQPVQAVRAEGEAVCFQQFFPALDFLRVPAAAGTLTGLALWMCLWAFAQGTFIFDLIHALPLSQSIPAYRRGTAG